jgi:hypothetical protein
MGALKQVDFHVTPAYGQDYSNTTQVKEAWHSGKDFVWHGQYLSKRDVVDGIEVWVRYGKLRKIVRVQ